MRRALYFAALLGTPVLPRALAQPVRPAPLARGEVRFVIHATIVGAIGGHAPVARAEFRGDDLSAVRGWAEVRVAELQTGNGTRDRHLREAMRADSYPVIRFDLDSVLPGAPAGDSTPVICVGRLTVHGFTRPVSAAGWVRSRPDAVDVGATFSLDMRSYGIAPPVRALLLRVSPEVAITADLSFARPAAPSP